jgi:hypothetical protein
MASINRYRTGLSGFAGGPGVSTMYCLTPDPFQGALSTWWEAIRQVMPANVSIAQENTGDVIDSTSGILVGGWTTSLVPPKSGVDTGGYGGPAGAVVTWLTGDILDGHRLRGRTFIVPMAANNFDTDGTLDAAVISTIQNASAALVTAAANNFVVWHRPREAKAATPTSLAVTQRAGGHSVVTASRVSDKVAVLRSRRD